MFTVIGLNEVIQLGSPVWARKYKASEASTCLMSYKKSKASTVGVRKHRERCSRTKPGETSAFRGQEEEGNSGRERKSGQ